MIKNVVFMGTPDFAVPILQGLLDSAYEVAGVFTQPDRPKGRSGQLQMTPVKELAVRYDIPVFQPRRLRDAENADILKQLSPDVIVVAAYGQIIPKEILTLPPYGCVNVHASLLPKYRGAAPIQWTILDGEPQTGVTTMQMGEGLDTGDILEKTVVPITTQETGGSLFDTLSREGAALLLHTLRALAEGSIHPTPQPEASPTPYAQMLTREMGRIDFSKSAQQIERMVRALTPWPSAYTAWKGKQLKLWRCEVLPQSDFPQAADTPEGGSLPGTVLRADPGGILIQTGEGCLLAEEVQLEGKKRMDAASFLRGNALHAGEVLGT